MIFPPDWLRRILSIEQPKTKETFLLLNIDSAPYSQFLMNLTIVLIMILRTDAAMNTWNLLHAMSWTCSEPSPFFSAVPPPVATGSADALLPLLPPSFPGVHSMMRWQFFGRTLIREWGGPKSLYNLAKGIRRGVKRIMDGCWCNQQGVSVHLHTVFLCAFKQVFLNTNHAREEKIRSVGPKPHQNPYPFINLLFITSNTTR